MLLGLGEVWLGLVAALLLRPLLVPAGRPVPPGYDLLTVLALVLCFLHAYLSLRFSHLAFLSTLPAALVTALLAAAALGRRRRGGTQAPGALGRWAIRGAAAAALLLVGCSALRVVEVEKARARGKSFASIGREDPVPVTDLRKLPWSQAFAELGRTLDREYPFREWKGLDLQATVTRLAPRVAAAAARSDRRAFYRALRELAWSIPDGHVALRGDDAGLAEEETGGDYGLTVVELDDGRLFVSRVVPGGPAAAARIAVGDEVLRWNDAAPEEALARVSVLWSDEPPATREGKRRLEARFLTRAPVGARAEVRFRKGSAVRTVTLAAVALPAPQGHERRDLLLDSPIEAYLRPDGVGYVRIKYELPTLRNLLPERKLARALARFRAHRAPGMILDLRGNRGGQDLLVPRLTAFFLPRPQVYEMPGVFHPALGRFLPAPEDTVRILPAEPRFAGRVAVLVDGETFSAAEGIPMVLKGLPNVRVIGFAATQGSFGIDEKAVLLPAGLALGFPQAQSLDGAGRIEVDSDASGRGGVEPDERLPFDEAAFSAQVLEGRDLALEAGLRFVLGR